MTGSQVIGNIFVRIWGYNSTSIALLLAPWPPTSWRWAGSGVRRLAADRALLGKSCPPSSCDVSVMCLTVTAPGSCSNTHSSSTRSARCSHIIGSPTEISGSGSSVSNPRWHECLDLNPLAPRTVRAMALTGLHVGVPADWSVPHRQWWGCAAHATGRLRFLVPQIPSRHLRAQTCSHVGVSIRQRTRQTSSSQPRVYVSRSLPSLKQPVTRLGKQAKTATENTGTICYLQNWPIAEADIMAFRYQHWGVELDHLGTDDQHSIRYVMILYAWECNNPKVYLRLLESSWMRLFCCADIVVSNLAHSTSKFSRR